MKFFMWSEFPFKYIISMNSNLPTEEHCLPKGLSASVHSLFTGELKTVYLYNLSLHNRTSHNCNNF